MAKTFNQIIEDIRPQRCGLNAETGELDFYGVVDNPDSLLLHEGLAELRHRWEAFDRAEAELAFRVDQSLSASQSAFARNVFADVASIIADIIGPSPAPVAEEPDAVDAPTDCPDA